MCVFDRFMCVDGGTLVARAQVARLRVRAAELEAQLNAQRDASGVAVDS